MSFSTDFTFMDYPDKLVFVDLETTGGRVSYDRIIEIGILRIENNELVDTYQTLINPQMYLSPFIENMTGIHQEDLEKAPIFNEIKEEVLERISDCTFVAHNVRFDYGFLRNEFKRHNIAFSTKHFCTARLSRILYPHYRKHNLDSIIERFGFVCENRHRAFDDAKVLWDFMQNLKQEFTGEKLSKALNQAMKKTSMPTLVTEEKLEKLPESPGAYIFYSSDDTPLYVGKSINIKERVLSHFANDYQSSKEMSMCRQTAKIDVVSTAGELGALFKESELIKTLQPLYNRRLRITKSFIIAKKNTDKDGYNTIELQEAKKITPDMLDEVLGVFKSKKQAKSFLNTLVKEFSLCEKYLGLEKTKGNCFSHKLGICKGACAGKESPLQYNARFIMAFSDYKIKSWPFNSSILINEEDSFNDTRDGFIVDNWCLLGNVKFDEDSVSYRLTDDISFDLDIYNILCRFLKSPGNLKKIKPFNREQINILTVS